MRPTSVGRLIISAGVSLGLAGYECNLVHLQAARKHRAEALGQLRVGLEQRGQIRAGHYYNLSILFGGHSCATRRAGQQCHLAKEIARPAQSLQSQS